MTKIIDARGLACPRPVMLTKQALLEAEEITCIVDNATARENVSRMAAKEGCQVVVEEKEGLFHVHIKTGQADQTCQPMPATASVMMIGANTLGRGSDELGQVLMRAFMHTLAEGGEKPTTLIFMNSGVKLVVSDSVVLEDLRALASQGVEIVACGTCLDYYKLKDQVAVGQVSNMYSILETMNRAHKVVSL